MRRYLEKSCSVHVHCSVQRPVSDVYAIQLDKEKRRMNYHGKKMRWCGHQGPFEKAEHKTKVTNKQSVTTGQSA